MVITSRYHINMEKRIRNFAFLTSRGCGTSRDTYFSQISVSTFSPLGKNTCFLHLLNFVGFFFPMWQMMKMNYYAVVGTFPGSLTYQPPERGVLQTLGDNSEPRCSPILLCNSEQKLKDYVQHIFNNTFPLGLHGGDENYHTFLKTRTPKKSPTDEIHSLSLPERPPKDTGFLK